MKAGELVEISSVKAQAARAEAYYWGEIERCERELPAMVAGLDPAGVRDQLEKFFKVMRQRSREKFSEIK
jgi:hypothetical protein